MASRHLNLFQKLPEDIIDSINDFLKLSDMPKIKPDYCLPWQRRAKEKIESLDIPSEEAISPDLHNQMRARRRLRINNCCGIS